ncbi:MAG TPA: trypsin-like peptidase domain-containing protein [Candidatus Acidoferrum sp.]|nr:trypsin-like peptidase domain-containing protein [Candidatus Acidoferrum sp.]
MASRRLLLFSLACLICACALRARADTLTITSTPPGASVEINGVIVGTTPYEEEMPGGYFHKTKTALGRRLQHSMTARISMAGYTTKELQMTEGPMNWVSLKGHNHGEYWLVKTNHFHVDLDPISKVFTGSISADIPGTADTPENIATSPALPLEDVIAHAKAAVVRLKGLSKAGSGFFVTEKGVIATNAHLARGESSLLAVLPSGQQLAANIIHVDPERDIALVKVEGDEYPYLSLAAASNVRQGETVIAIGNPGGAMPFAATKGIVSAVGKFSAAGPGIWIQTDATINPGNSGGPLLNARGQVIGINTLKLEKKDVTGIGFAISASDLLAVLLQYFPDPNAPGKELLASPVSAARAKTGSADRAFGIIEFSEPQAAEIYVDGKFVGDIPASIPLAAGQTYLIVVKASGHADWSKRISVLPGMHTVLDPWPASE